MIIESDKGQNKVIDSATIKINSFLFNKVRNPYYICFAIVQKTKMYLK